MLGGASGDSGTTRPPTVYECVPLAEAVTAVATARGNTIGNHSPSDRIWL